MATINAVPDEIILTILADVPSDDLIRCVQRLSRRFHRLSSEPRLWHARCRDDFTYWTADNRARLRGRGGRTRRRTSDAYHTNGEEEQEQEEEEEEDWKQMWLDRRRGDARSARHFEGVLASKVHRVRNLEAICRRGLDAKDFLLRQLRAADNDEAVLARRYYASTALSSINRGLAVEEWCRVRRDFQGYGRLDRALAAFDMFVLHDAPQDMDAVQRLLDGLADRFRAAHAGIGGGLATMTVRQKALALVRWLRSQNLMGIANPERDYRNLRNCLIGHALTDHPEHPSLPIVSSAIFVCVAQRLGLEAYCITVPGHVHCTVLAPPGETVDGTPLSETAPPPLTNSHQPRSIGEDGRRGGAAQRITDILDPPSNNNNPNNSRPRLPLSSSLVDNGERIFLDPYARDDEVPLSGLRALIRDIDWGWGGGATASADRDNFVLPAPTSAIVLRVALNLEASWTHANQVASAQVVDNANAVAAVAEPAAAEEALRLRRGNPDLNLAALMYATIWVSVLMRPTGGPGWDRRLDGLLAHFAHSYSEDVWIVERFLVPLYDEYAAALHQPAAAFLAHGGGGGHMLPTALGEDVSRALGTPGGGGTAQQQQQQQRQQQQQPQPQRHNWRYRPTDWTDPRVMVKMVYNLDARQPQVSRRYTQEICERVTYRVGQVFRHRRFGYVGIINGWSPDDPKNLPAPANMPQGESASDGDESGMGSGASTPTRQAPPGGDPGRLRSTHRKRMPYYTCLRAGAEHHFVVAQKNVEIVTDPAAIPEPLFFLAGRHFKRFDRATCTFVSNLREFYPDD